MEFRAGFFAPDLHGDTLAPCQTGVVAGLRVEAGHDLFFGLAADVQAEDIAGLNRVEAGTVRLKREAELLEEPDISLVRHKRVGVDFQRVGLVAQAVLLHGQQQRAHGVGVMQIADRPARRIHQLERRHRDLPQQHGADAPDRAVLLPQEKAAPIPFFLDAPPGGGLHHMALRM